VSRLLVDACKTSVSLQYMLIVADAYLKDVNGVNEKVFLPAVPVSYAICVKNIY
jgi:hypothetical protein